MIYFFIYTFHNRISALKNCKTIAWEIAFSYHSKPKKVTGLPCTVRCLFTNALNDETQLPMKWSAFVMIAMSIIGSSTSLSPLRTWTATWKYHNELLIKWQRRQLSKRGKPQQHFKDGVVQAWRGGGEYPKNCKLK